ncbi:MAG: nitrate reductase [Bacteroidetes bacterium 4572_77]|nr:MAG: nitrate reductase [Bacteroidetes bacterium 4572_77]
MNTRFLIILIVVATGIVAFTTKAPEMSATDNTTFFSSFLSPDTTLTEEQIGYRHDDLYDEDAVVLDEIDYFSSAPGTNSKIERSFENAPPMIPHTMVGFVPIKAGSNACLTCHMPAVAAAMNSTAIPTSHFTDYRPAVIEKDGKYKVDAKEGEVVAKDLAGQLNQARWNCTQCHVAQAKVSVFIPNGFNPNFRQEQDAKGSNLNTNIGEGVK